MGISRLTRRTLLQTAATTALAAPFVHGAFAAGKLAVGFWDHWVPGANDTLTKLCHEWADKEKVDITIDYITSQADKLNLSQAAEAQAKSGHDLLTFLAWAAAARPRSPNSCGPSPRRRARRDASMRRCRSSGAPGTSRPTNPRRRAC